MADIAKAIYARLTATSAVTTIVGSQIYPAIVPQDINNPAITYSVVSKNRTSAMGADAGLTTARVTVQSFADQYSEMKTLAEAVRSALQRWSGVSGGVTVQAIFIDNEIDNYDSDDKSFYMIQDFICHYNEG